MRGKPARSIPAAVEQLDGRSIAALIDQRDCFTERVWPAIVAVPFRLRGLPV